MRAYVRGREGCFKPPTTKTKIVIRDKIRFVSMFYNVFWYSFIIKKNYWHLISKLLVLSLFLF